MSISVLVCNQRLVSSQNIILEITESAGNQQHKVV